MPLPELENSAQETGASLPDPKEGKNKLLFGVPYQNQEQGTTVQGRGSYQTRQSQYLKQIKGGSYYTEPRRETGKELKWKRSTKAAGREDHSSSLVIKDSQVKARTSTVLHLEEQNTVGSRLYAAGDLRHWAWGTGRLLSVVVVLRAWIHSARVCGFDVQSRRQPGWFSSPL